MIDVNIPPDHLETIKKWLGSGSINIFGLPFAGKDTHGETLTHLLGACLLGGGEILRGSTIPSDLKAQLDAGILFPTDEYLRIVTPYLSRPEFENKPLILSSVGRWIGEEEGVMQATAASGHPTKAVIYLHAGDEVVYRRWKKSQEKGDRAGRADDAEHVLATRIEEFNTKTLPVIEVYRQKGLLIEVNSDAEKQEVLENILARLYLRATSA
ncbi:nucleoside monophosphate kinase [Streptomyces caniscabiei]|uniref:nucleoside monophosphate kinase n=1 Tax=Streptomyces caniscabiei TaxID=2746961 RepID=UPI0029AA055F|nr:nucleoside monophosphate kinase [Streptomyces caniscabiei]MDX2776520.1 nucleoside monophosphate kinase [Streptomyces caniscabiei]